MLKYRVYLNIKYAKKRKIIFRRKTKKPELTPEEKEQLILALYNLTTKLF